MFSTLLGVDLMLQRSTIRRMTAFTNSGPLSEPSARGKPKSAKMANSAAATDRAVLSGIPRRKTNLVKTKNNNQENVHTTR